MPGIVIVGAQWGDEGKGKVVDLLAERAEGVVRFQGGNNAGHTIVVGGQTYKLHLLPSGVVSGKKSVIGNGCVVDPFVLLSEVEGLRARGLEPHLYLSDRAHLILPSGECIIVGSEKSVTLPDGTLLDLRPETTPADEIGTAFAADAGKSRLQKGPCP